MLVGFLPTVILQVAFIPLKVTQVIVAVPSLIPVTIPSPSTDAIFGFDELYCLSLE